MKGICLSMLLMCYSFPRASWVLANPPVGLLLSQQKVAFLRLWLQLHLQPCSYEDGAVGSKNIAAVTTTYLQPREEKRLEITKLSKAMLSSGLPVLERLQKKKGANP